MLNEKTFGRCKSIPEITLLKQKLLQAGEDANLVNRLASQRRMELVLVTDESVNWLEKVTMEREELTASKYSHINVELINPTVSTEMVIHGDGRVSF